MICSIERTPRAVLVAVIFVLLFSSGCKVANETVTSEKRYTENQLKVTELTGADWEMLELAEKREVASELSGRIRKHYPSVSPEYVYERCQEYYRNGYGIDQRLIDILADSIANGR